MKLKHGRNPTGITSTTAAVDDRNKKVKHLQQAAILNSFFVTGFGPFGGNPENPASTAIEALQQEQPAKNPCLCNVHLLSIIRVSVSSLLKK